MNRELADVVKIYSTGTHKELHDCLLGKSKDTLISMLVDLLTAYINDKNSSTLREFITVTFAGYEHKGGKIGYNGFKYDTHIPGKTIRCEAKPKNFDTEEIEKFKKGERKTSPAKLNGGGNFTDYTPARLAKDMAEKGLNMLVSGFVNGKLIYILEFPFSCPTFRENLEKHLKNWEAKLKGSNNTKGQFLRSAGFDYRAYIDSDDLKVVFLLNRDEIEMYKQYISRDFYNILKGLSK